MFTIKQITKSGESLWEGKNPKFNAAGPGGKSQFEFDMPDTGHCTIDAGAVYVMNGSGNTVGRYFLEGSDQLDLSPS